jgi:hypothetical protein
MVARIFLLVCPSLFFLKKKRLWDIMELFFYELHFGKGAVKQSKWVEIERQTCKRVRVSVQDLSMAILFQKDLGFFEVSRSCTNTWT